MRIRTLMKVNPKSPCLEIGGLANLRFYLNIFGKYQNYCTCPKKLPATLLTKAAAEALILKLSESERTVLLLSLREFEAERLKAEYRDKLAAFRWRSKFGRPSKIPNLGDVDPTGSYCPVPEDWLYRKYAEVAVKPSIRELFIVAAHNAIPFVGFGFLDNFLMIICGDYIEAKIGTIMVISTMAAAALGNTLSDILGLGSAYYVEQMAAKVGVKPPALSPVQLDMPTSRFAANLGRVVGLVTGCIMGMVPLLFHHNKEETDENNKSK